MNTYDPVVLDAMRDMLNNRHWIAGREPRRILESQRPDLAELASKHKAKASKVEYTPAARPRIDYGLQKHQPTMAGYPSLFDPLLADMPRLAMYQHQVFPDIHVSAKKETPWEPASFEAWSGLYPDESLSDEIRPKARRELYAGKRALDGDKVTMPPGAWHVDPEVKWSTKRLHCAICGAELPAARRKYCADACATKGSNTVRRNKTARKKARKWPADESGWYVQTTPAQVVRRLRVHRFDEWESQVKHTVSRDYRLRAPWAGEPNVWRVMKLTSETGRLAC